MTPSEFKNAREVWGYLSANGWAISQRSVHAHMKDGLLKAGASGLYELKAVQKYASLHLVRKDTRMKVEDEDIQRMIKKAELKYKVEQGRLAEFNRLKEEGRYILREDSDLQMAQMMVIFDAILRQMNQTRAADYIALVDGDEAKVADLIRAMNDDADEVMNECATTKEFNVVFDIDDDETEKEVS